MRIGTRSGLRRSCEVEQVPYDARRTQCLLAHLSHELLDGLLEVLPLQQIGVPDEGGEGVVQLVGDASEGLPDERHLLGLDDAVAREFLFRHVGQRHERADVAAAVQHADRRAGQLYGRLAARLGERGAKAARDAGRCIGEFG